MSPSRSQRRCLIRIRLDPFPHLPASPYFAAFEHRSAFNSIECGNVPSLHLAMDLPSIWRWRLSDMSPSRSQRRCLIRIRLDPFPHLPASPYFATFERRRAFNSFECGDVPSLHLAMDLPSIWRWRLSDMSPSRSQRRCLIRIRLDPFPHLPASPYFATFERRRAFNSFECGDVPSLHLAMEAVGYVAVEIATALLDPDTPRPFPASSGFALLRGLRAPFCI